MNAPTVQLPTLPAAILLMLITCLLMACGGGGGEQSSSLTSQPIENNLPLGEIISGDYFPLETGSRWIFDVTVSDSWASTVQYLSSQVVAGAATVGGQKSQLIRNVNPENGDLISLDYMTKTANAVSAYFEDNTPSIDIVHLPLRQGEHFVQVDRKNIDVGVDYDGDGINETMSLFFEVTVAGFEEVQTPAGLFTQALKVQGQGTATYYYSRNGEQFVVNHTTVDWYVDGVGLVKQIETLIAPNRNLTTTHTLKSYKVGSRTNDVLQPSIIQASPAEGSLQGGLPVVRIQFSENIDVRTFNPVNITLRDASGQSIQGDINYVNQILTFTPKQALASGRYTFYVVDTIGDLLGNALSKSLSLSFNVDAEAPSVVANMPLTSAKMVPLDSNITVTFNEEIDPASVSTTSVLLYGASYDSVPVAVKVVGKSIVITPNVNLKRNQQYEVYVSPATKDLTGNALPEGYRFTFVTDIGLVPMVVANYPQSGSTVAQKSVHEITLDFNEELSDNSIGYGAIQMFKITGEKNEEVFFSRKLDGKRVVITPDRILDRDGQYKVCANTTLQDLAGNTLREPYCFGFKVQAGIFFPAKMIRTNSPSDAIAIGDVNGDGRNDVVMATSSGYLLSSINDFDFKLAIFIQQQDGSLAAPVKYQLQQNPACVAKSIAIADVDNDGKPEIMVGEPYCGIEVFTQEDAGRWSKREQLVTDNGAKIRAADLNHDGKMDIVGAGWSATSGVSVWYQENGKLKAPVSYNLPHLLSVDLEVGDINDDGRQDVVAFSEYQSETPASLSYILQLPSGGFGAPNYLDVGAHGIFGGSGAIDIGDVNSDGYSDIVSAVGANQPITINVFAQNPSHQFTATTHISTVQLPGAVEIGDVNNDGRNDVLITHWAENLSLFLQSADGTLQAEELYNITYGAAYGNNTLAVGDINSDGYKDVVVVTSYGYLGILYNSGGVGPMVIGDLQFNVNRNLLRNEYGKKLYKPKLKTQLTPLLQR